MSRKRQNNEKVPVANKRRHVATESEESDDDDGDVDMVDASMPPIRDSAKRSGKINKIVLKNFMCHSNLVIEFNKSVTLLVGNNGSGKSAVLTALVVGLGSKSSATNRCTNIGQLIKRGETNGSVTIHISNSCEQGYERELYGPEIVVQRSFSINGSSSYRIKKASGQVVSTNRKDLLKILLFMNIQVDNPVCVLNQDASRAFLKESDPKKRFKFFLKATQVDTAIEKLNDCGSHYTAAKKHFEFQKTLLKTAKEELSKIQAKYDSLQSIGYLKKTLNALKIESCWLKVENEENLHAEIMDTLNKYQKVYDTLMASLQNRRNGDGNREARCELLNTQIDELKKEAGVSTAQRQKMRQNIGKDEEAKNQIQRELQKIVKKFENNENNIKQLQNDMSESGEAQRERIAKEKEANEKKLEECIQKKSECESMKENALRDIEMMRNTKTKLEETIHNLQNKRSIASRNVDKIEADLRQCGSSKNSLTLYGTFMPELLKHIEQMHKKGEFRQLPRGPLGRYIEVTDEKFKAPVELILKSKMMAFCVNDARDRETLNRLIKKMSGKYPDIKRCSVITMGFVNSVYSVSRGKVEPVPNGTSVMDAIKCNDPIVMNVLIDHCKIEKILIVEDEQSAFNVTEHVENVPRNLMKVFLLNPLTEMYPAPNVRAYGHKKEMPRFLQVDMKQRKEYLTNEWRVAKDRLAELTEEIAAESVKKNQFATTLQEKVRIGDRFDENLRKYAQKIKELESVEYPGENEREMLENELQELIRGRDTFEERKSEIKQRMDEKQAVIAEKYKEMKVVEENIRKINEKIEEKQMEIYQENDLAAEESANVNAEQRKADKIQESLTKVQAQELECNRKLKGLIQSAENQGERVSVTNTQDYLTAKIKETEKVIKTVFESSDSIEEVEAALQAKSTEVEDKGALVSGLEKTLSKLKTSRQKRYFWLLKFKSHLSVRVQHAFNQIMKLRDYDGTISVDHQNELLDLSVVPRDKHIANSVSSANCLSGGERSFSTVAFLLALWSVVDSPFYFLDEYDVYTDAINRHYMTTLLLDEAKKKQHRQYTFLTPQDMSDIVPSNDLSIQRMADPIRK